MSKTFKTNTGAFRDFAFKVGTERLITTATAEGDGRSVTIRDGRVVLTVSVQPVPAELVAILDKLFDDGSGGESPEVCKVLRLIHKLQMARSLAEELT